MSRLAPMTPADWPAVRAIYLEGIATAQATFEKSAPVWEVWDARHLPACRLVARDDEYVLGWAALSPVSARTVYSGVAEVSVYVAGRVRGQGIGGLLLGALVTESEQNGIWTLQASIFPENLASIALHRKFGFRTVGARHHIGCMDGVWRDTILLERRSTIAGV